MDFLTQVSLLFVLIATVIAVTLSFEPRNAVCVFLASSQTASNTSPLRLLLTKTIHPLWCRRGPLQDKRDNWNLLYHLGGNGPWIEKFDARYSTYRANGEPPEGCVIDQVHMLSRHAERYPTKGAGARHLALLSRLESNFLNGSLSFLNDRNWTYFVTPSSSSPTFEDLTTTSSHAGTLSAFTLGTTFRTRYSHLLPSPSAIHNLTKTVNFWSASSPRDVETALYFADGFFGRDWSLPTATHPAHLHIIPESPSRAGNTLTPGDTCLLYVANKTHGHDQGYGKLASWQSVFAPAISSRLSAPNPHLHPTFSPAEVYSMMEMCGFEMLARGSSPWCDVFSRSEWEDFEYGRDMLHFYRAGPGNRYSAAMGGLWLDATANLLVQDSDRDGNDVAGSGEIYASFVHDGDIVPVLATLGLLDEEGKREGEGQANELPTDHVKRNRNWRTSDIVPMAGRLVIERLNCRTPHGWRYRDVRLFINDGWVGWPVEGAEGKTVFVPQVEVGRFREMVGRKRKGLGGFREVCGLKRGVEEAIQFLHQ